MGFIINIIQYTKMIELHDPEKVSITRFYFIAKQPEVVQL